MVNDTLSLILPQYGTEVHSHSGMARASMFAKVTLAQNVSNFWHQRQTNLHLCGTTSLQLQTTTATPELVSATVQTLCTCGP